MELYGTENIYIYIRLWLQSQHLLVGIIPLLVLVDNDKKNIKCVASIMFLDIEASVLDKKKQAELFIFNIFKASYCADIINCYIIQYIARKLPKEAKQQLRKFVLPF